MSCLVIPDVHEKFHILKKIVDHYYNKVARIVLLGDFYDAWGPTDLRRAGLTAKMDAELIMDPKVTRIMGNHCIQYFYPDINDLKCSGYKPEKILPILSHMTDRHIAKVKFHTWEQGWLLSHAGLHPNFMHSITDFSKEYLSEQDDLCAYMLKYEARRHHWTRAGKYRGGDQSVGGIIWLDFRKEFVPISGLNQIVGHTEHEFPSSKSLENGTSNNHCIDTNLSYVGIIEDDGTFRTEATF